MILCTAPTANVPQQIHLEKGVTVKVVFGIKDIDRSGLPSGHVLSEKVLYFTLPYLSSYVN